MVLGIFKRQMVDFLDELIEQFPHEADLIIVRIFFKDQIPVAEVMNKVIQYVLPHKEMIVNKDDRYFLEHDDLFSNFSAGKVLVWKRLWVSPQLEKDDKEAIWAWFASFVVLAEKYQEALSSERS